MLFRSGGHCIAVDPWFIVDSAPEQAHLIHVARIVNDGKPYHIVERVREKATRFKDPIIACLGLSFKADIDDLRESPAVDIVEMLAEDKMGRLLIVEPHIKKLPTSLTDRADVELVELHDALKQADIVVLLVNHRLFKDVDKDLISSP